MRMAKAGRILVYYYGGQGVHGLFSEIKISFPSSVASSDSMYTVLFVCLQPTGTFHSISEDCRGLMLGRRICIKDVSDMVLPLHENIQVASTKLLLASRRHLSLWGYWQPIYWVANLHRCF